MHNTIFILNIRLIHYLDQFHPVSLVPLDNPFIIEMEIPKPSKPEISVKHEIDDTKIPKSAKFLLVELFISHYTEDAFSLTLGPSEQFADCLHTGVKKGMKNNCRNNLNKAVISHFNFGNKMYESQDGMWKSSVIFPISNGVFYASFGNLDQSSYIQLIVRGFYYSQRETIVPSY